MEFGKETIGMRQEYQEQKEIAGVHFIFSGIEENLKKMIFVK